MHYLISTGSKILKLRRRLKEDLQDYTYLISSNSDKSKAINDIGLDTPFDKTLQFLD